MKSIASFIVIALVASVSSGMQVDTTAARPVVAPAPAPAPVPPPPMPMPNVPVPAAPATPPAKCSCTMPASIMDGFASSTTPIMKATAVESLKPDKNYAYTVMMVKAVFRGCLPKKQYIIVRSPNTQGSCGVTYVPGTTYAITVKYSRSSTPPPGIAPDLEVYTATSCGYNKPWSKCPQSEKVQLYYAKPTCKN